MRDVIVAVVVVLVISMLVEAMVASVVVVVMVVAAMIVAAKVVASGLVVIVIARLSTLPNVKVPEVEQLLSAGAAAQNILLAAHALGYAAVWKTGDVAYNHHFKSELGLAANEHIIGILFVGTRADTMGNKPGPDTAPFHSVWPA